MSANPVSLIVFLVLFALVACLAGMLILGIYPQPLLNAADNATQPLNALNSRGNVIAQR